MSYNLYLAVPGHLYDRYTNAAESYNSSPFVDRNSGFDLFNEVDLKIEEEALLRFGIEAAAATPAGTSLETAAFWLCPRSSISKTHLICANSQGLIDKGYRGPIMGAVRNLIWPSYEEFVPEGGRLFQLVPGDAQPWNSVTICRSSSDLPRPVTARGAGGFGSTGQ
jgi:dUTPase